MATTPLKAYHVARSKVTRSHRHESGGRWRHEYLGASSGFWHWSPWRTAYEDRKAKLEFVMEIMANLVEGGISALYASRETLPSEIRRIVEVRHRKDQGLPKTRWGWSEASRRRAFERREKRERARREEAILRGHAYRAPRYVMKCAGENPGEPGDLDVKVPRKRRTKFVEPPEMRLGGYLDLPDISPPRQPGSPAPEHDPAAGRRAFLLGIALG